MIHQEIHALRRHFSPWLLAFIFCLAVFSIFGLQQREFFDVKIPVLSTIGPNIVTQIFLKIEHDVLPQGVQLVSLSPITVFLLQLKIALFASFAMSLPIFLYCMVRYISPALFVRERLQLIFVTVMISFFFLLGVIFSYKFLVLQMFTILFSFNHGLQVASMLDVNEFMSWTLASLFVTGVLFLLPFFMYGLCALRVVSSRFWVQYFREVFLGFLIISAIITPDVSGVSILILSIPMVALYSLGIIATSSMRALK